MSTMAIRKISLVFMLDVMVVRGRGGGRLSVDGLSRCDATTFVFTSLGYTG